MTTGRLFRTELVETNDGGDLQTTRLLGVAGEELTDVHRVSHFGVHSVAPPGSHGLGMQFLSGGRTLTAALGFEHPDYRPRDGKPGQTRIYDASGNASRFLGDDGIWHDAGSRPHKMTGKTVTQMGTDEAAIGASSGKTYVGGDGKTGTSARAMTESGPSNFVMIRIG